MKCIVWLIALLFFVTPPLSRAQGDADADARTKVIALEKAWNQAYKLGDAKALSAILDDNLVLVEDDGSMKNKAQFLATVKAATSNEEQVVPESLKVQIFGKTAIAVGVIGVKGKSGVRRERFVDTWIYKSGNWVCVATDATPIVHGGS
jgi:ketosteroid isomerase-like protein